MATISVNLDNLDPTTAALLTALIAATEPSAPAVPAEPKTDGRNKAARKHNYEARMARRSDKRRASNGAGMTKAEKSALYRSLPKNAQGKVETFHFDSRKHIVEYDDVLNRQRDVIYADRDRVLEDENLKGLIMEWVEETLVSL